MIVFTKNTAHTNTATMPAGGFSAVSKNDGTVFEAKITPIVVISCVMAATGGLMFGYDVGISGHY